LLLPGTSSSGNKWGDFQKGGGLTDQVQLNIWDYHHRKNYSVKSKGKKQKAATLLLTTNLHINESSLGKEGEGGNRKKLPGEGWGRTGRPREVNSGKPSREPNCPLLWKAYQRTTSEGLPKKKDLTQSPK